MGVKKVKIAIIIGQLSFGGAERQIMLLAKGLKKSGEFKPIVFCLSENVEPNGAILTQLGIEWYSIPKGTRASFAKMRWLIQQVKILDCSLLYGILHIGNIYAGAAAIFLNLPLICSIRNADAFLPSHIRLLSGYFCKRSKFVIANSNSALHSLRNDLSVTRSRVRVIPNAVDEQPDLARPKMLLSDWQVADDSLVIGTIALLKKQKRPEFFLTVAQHTSAEWSGKPLHFVWIGDGAERNNVEKWLAGTSQCLQERIHFPGARKDVVSCLSAFDVFLLTSAYEGMPNALLEAMAAGLPCVATNVPGTRDVIKNQNGEAEIGVLADADNPKVFADTLVSLLHNPKRRQEMGANAQQYVKSRYSLEKMVNSHLEVFSLALVRQI